MHFRFPLTILGAVLPFASFVRGVELDPDNEASIRAATKQYAYGLMSYYKGNASGLPKEDVGVFPKPPYYWWEGGAAWGGMIEYTQFTGDESYVDTLTQALVANYGPDNNILLEWKRDQEVWVYHFCISRMCMLTVCSRATMIRPSGLSV